jgi:hypothetical protein
LIKINLPEFALDKKELKSHQKRKTWLKPLRIRNPLGLKKA